MPDILETFVICTIVLLGVDTIPKSIDAMRKNCKKKDSENDCVDKNV